jgi:hypothetical protein
MDNLAAKILDVLWQPIDKSLDDYIQIWTAYR